MNVEVIETIAARLASHRRHRTVADLPLGGIESEAEALEIQTEALASYGFELDGYVVTGACEITRRSLGLDKPVFSPVPSDGFISEGQPVTIPRGAIGAQPQLLFTFLRQYPDNNEIIDRETVRTAVLGVQPSIGLLARRTMHLVPGRCAAIADFAFHAVSVRGDFREPGVFSSGDDVMAQVSVNGIEMMAVPLATSSEHPLDALVWLAGQLRQAGRQINAGDMVVTGIAAPIFQILPAQEMTVDFGSIGRVTCAFA